ncbi:hypothetical protein B0H14DRAFT_2637445 [Mycena olivaceomarginata]|nr:hypothetical protein B0H14DRAFT_2637445 [Mycena olivaceomarginata]
MSGTFSRIAPESKDSKSNNSNSPTVPTRGPLTGHYRIGEQINGVINGWPYFVLWTPSPKEHPPLDFTSRRVPHFNNPTYIDARSAYLMFIPKHDPWHGLLLGVLEYTWDSLPIEEHTPGRWCLKYDTLMAWGEFDAALRSFAHSVIFLLGNHILPDGCPWGSPFHFGFGITRKSEHNARAAAWNARRGFLPLLGFLSMGLWCMRYHAQNKEDANMDGNAGANLGKRKRAEGEHVPWQVLLAQETGLHSSWIDWAETSVAGDWIAPRVGGLFHVGPTNTRDWLPEELTGLEWLLDTIIDEQPNIPLYFHWGVLPPYQIHSTKYLKSRRFLPDLEEMDYLEALPGLVTFNPWNMLGDGTFESGRPHAPTPSSLSCTRCSLTSFHSTSSSTRLLKPIPSSSASAALAAASSSLSRPPAQLLDFPPIEKDSGQKAGESLDAFFLRRQAENSRRSERESLTTDKLERSVKPTPKRDYRRSESVVMILSKTNGIYAQHLGMMTVLAMTTPPDDNDEPVESGDVVLTDRDLVPRHDWRDPFPDDDENDTYYNERLPEMFRPTGAAEVSAHALTRIYLKATSASGQDPEQENSAQGQPVYEQIATNVLHALNHGFGFVKGHNVPAPFDAPPPLVVMRLVGQDDCSVRRTRGCFLLAQCLQGSSPGDIAGSLFDFHQATSALHRPWPYELGDHAHDPAHGLFHSAGQTQPTFRRESGSRDIAPLATRQTTMRTLSSGTLFCIRAEVSVALQYGGVIAPAGVVAGVCLWDQESSYAYWYDSLTDREIGILCGVYHVRTGEFDSGANAEQMSHLSWWRKPNTGRQAIYTRVGGCRIVKNGTKTESRRWHETTLFC